MCALRYVPDRKIWLADQYFNGKRRRLTIHREDKHLSHAENQVLAERKYQEIEKPKENRRTSGDIEKHAREYIEWIKHIKSDTTATNERQRLNGTILPYFRSKGIKGLNETTYQCLEDFVALRKKKAANHAPSMVTSQ